MNPLAPWVRNLGMNWNALLWNQHLKMAKPTPIKKPVVSEAKVTWVSTRIAAKLLDFTIRNVQTLCERRCFRTAHKPGFGLKAHWRIDRNEVIARKFDPTINQNL